MIIILMGLTVAGLLMVLAYKVYMFSQRRDDQELEGAKRRSEKRIKKMWEERDKEKQ